MGASKHENVVKNYRFIAVFRPSLVTIYTTECEIWHDTEPWVYSNAEFGPGRGSGWYRSRTNL